MFATMVLDERIARWSELKQWERREIGQKLRLQGLTYREIAAIIPVGKGTLSGWCRDLEIPLEHQARLGLAMFRADEQRRATRRSVGSVLRHRALARGEELRADARLEAEKYLDDPGWVAGVVAYWSEGAKRHKDVSFSNSDPFLVCLFIAWVERWVGVPRTCLTAKLHLHSGQCETERKSFWSETTGISLDNFRKTFIKPEGTGHRKNVLYNGTISVRVSRGGDLLHRFRGWIDAVADRYAVLQ